MDHRTRLCADCETDISGRHITAKRCKPCAALNNQKIWRNRAQYSRGKKRVCLDCNIDISDRHGLAVRCRQCAETEAARKARMSKSKYSASRPRRTRKRPRKQYPLRSCEWCEQSYTPKRVDQRTCSQECRMHHNRAEQNAKSYVTHSERTCLACSRPFVPPRSDSVACSAKCRDRLYYNYETAMAYNATRRARNKALAHEVINRAVIFERDEWVCHICNTAVDPAIVGGPNSASLDHIIPLSVAGSPGHVWSNVALAHLQCNMRKSNRPRLEDFLLHSELVSRSIQHARR